MRTLIAGIGSTILGDDGVGVHAVRRLRDESLPNGVDVEEVGVAGLGLVDLARGYDRLVVIDAMISGAKPGTVQVLRGVDVARAAHLGVAHEADLPQSLEIGRLLLGEKMPGDVLVVVIEAANINDFSEEMSIEVERAIPAALKAVRRIVGESV